MAAKSVLNTRERKKIIDGLVAQGVTVEQARMGHVVLKFADGDARTVNLATGDQAGITNTRVFITRKKGLRWPLDPAPRVRKPKVAAPEDQPKGSPLLEVLETRTDDAPDWGETGYHRPDLVEKPPTANDVAEAAALGITFSDQAPSAHDWAVAGAGAAFREDDERRTLPHLYVKGGGTGCGLCGEAMSAVIHVVVTKAPVIKDSFKQWQEAPPIDRKKPPVAATKKPKTRSSEVLSEWIDLTPALAEQLLAHNTENRNIRIPHVNALARDMAQGRWLVTGDSIKIDVNDRMVDGQHRCHAVIKSGATIRVMLVIGLEPEAREVIDTNAKRSASDALKFSGAARNLVVLAAVGRIALGRELGYYSTALDTSSPKLTNSEIVQWVEAHPEVQSAVDLAVKTNRAIGIAPGPWGYSLWKLGQVDPDDAREFALSMAEFRTEGTGDPRATMLNVFSRAQSQRRPILAAEAIFYVFRTWNAWRSSAQVMRLNPSGKRADLGGGVIPNPL